MNRENLLQKVKSHVKMELARQNFFDVLVYERNVEIFMKMLENKTYFNREELERWAILMSILKAKELKK